MENCLVCEANEFVPIYNNTLLRCASCGFVTTNRKISPETLRETYTENYFKGEEYVDYLRDKEILQKNFKKRLRFIYKQKDRSSITSVIEIGCAYGFFAELISNDLKNCRYTGYDVVPEAIEYGSKQLKQHVVCADYLEAESEEKVSDVFMWDVIEHLPAPDEYIEKAANELKAGGRIYITTGDIERLIPRMQKTKWRMIHPPSHLHYFSKRTLSKLLQRKGFKIVSVSYPPVYRSIRQIYYSLFMLRKKYPRFVEKIYTLIPPQLNIPVNTYDIMFLIAEKNDAIFVKNGK
jgi:2-polyprenyl-3-methyl-5-hydroxy-6-metoxy-1,4-benzoquinol methylase